jgi:hypothetical protein
MKTFILITVLSLSQFDAFASIITAKGESKNFGGSVECQNVKFVQDGKKQAETEANRAALLECQSQEGTENVILKRVSDFSDHVNCFYKGPWMSLSTLVVDVSAKYSCLSSDR